MTASEAMERVEAIEPLVDEAEDGPLNDSSIGVENQVAFALDAGRKVWAAALIKAQVEQTIRCQLQYQQLGWWRNEEKRLEAALKELEGRDETHDSTQS